MTPGPKPVKVKVESIDNYLMPTNKAFNSAKFILCNAQVDPSRVAACTVLL